MNDTFGHDKQIMGDDLTVTNQSILKEAVKTKTINSILIKLNQIGTLSETLDTIELAHKATARSAIVVSSDSPER